MSIPNIPIRKNIRLAHYDYTSVGVYHITICTLNRQHLFGTIKNGLISLTEAGQIADRNIRAIPDHFPESELFIHTVMPNHVHILLGIGTRAGAIYGAPTECRSLGRIIGEYKASVTRDLGKPVWQRQYYEHVIREDRDLIDTMEYIQNNPIKWDEDEYN